MGEDSIIVPQFVIQQFRGGFLCVRVYDDKIQDKFVSEDIKAVFRECEAFFASCEQNKRKECG